MENVIKFLLIGLLAIYGVQQSKANSGEVQTPDCSRFANGYKIPGQNPSHFYFCQNKVPIQMFCPPGLNFCYNGQFGVCSKFCTNVSPQPTEAGCGTSGSTGTGSTHNPESTELPTGSTSAGTGSTNPQSTELPTGPTTIGTGTTNPASTELPTGPTTAGSGTTIPQSTELPTGSTTAGSGTTIPQSTELPTGPTTAAQSSVSTQTATPPTTIATTPETTPAPPNIDTVCNNNGWGSIFSIVDDCSAFGVCIFGKPIIARCLGNRLFDPLLGICTGIKCSN